MSARTADTKPVTKDVPTGMASLLLPEEPEEPEEPEGDKESQRMGA